MATMQPQNSNQFPMSDDSSQPSNPPAPAVAPTPTPPPASSPAPIQPPATPAAATTAPATLAPASSPQPPVAPVQKPNAPLFVQPAFNPVGTKQPKGPLAPVEALLSRVFTKPAIAMPELAQSIIGQNLSWLSLFVTVSLALLLLFSLAMGGVLGFISSITTLNTNPAYWLFVVVLTVQVGAMIVAFPKLQREEYGGWQLLLITVLLGIIGLLFNIFAQIVSPIIGTLTGLFVGVAALYVLFQVRSYYNI